MADAKADLRRRLSRRLLVATLALGYSDTVEIELPGVVASAQSTLPVVHQGFGGSNVPEPPSVSKPKKVSDDVKKLQGIWTRVFDIQSGSCPTDVPSPNLEVAL